jgi:long-chain acyl-CoA synthetase
MELCGRGHHHQADRRRAHRAWHKAGRPGRLAIHQLPRVSVLLFRLLSVGAVAVPINTRFQAAELIYVINHSGAVLLLGQQDLCEPLFAACGELQHLAEILVAGTERFAALSRTQPVALPMVDDNQLAVLMYTSGTTTKPKGVMHSHATLKRQSANDLAVLGAAVYEQTLVSLPVCHIAAFSIFLLSATVAGGTVTILPRFEPGAVLRSIAENRITYAGGLPVMVNALVNYPDAGTYDLSSLRMFVAGGTTCRWNCRTASATCSASWWTSCAG